MSCQSGVRKENGVRVDYMEFRNNKQQVTNWQLEEFEPTLDGGDFGRRLQILRSNPQQLCIYLNHLIRYLLHSKFCLFINIDYIELQEFILESS